MKTWASIPKEFNDWWNQEYKDSTNPFALNSFAYWAWAGWSAAKAAPAAEEAPEQEPKKDLMWSTVAMQERHDQRIENIVATLERIKQEQQPATHGEPVACKTCESLARTVMLDHVSFDRKPDCYGIRQITDDEGVEEWEDIRTSPDVAREEANDMMATGRGEIYEVVPLFKSPQPTPELVQAARQALEALIAWEKYCKGHVQTVEALQNALKGTI